MTWIKLDDQAVDHPKVANLSDRAFRWWVKGLSYASRFLTNGYLPAVFVRQVPKKSQDELTTPNLWTPKECGGMEIHDYLAHQSSKESVTKKRAETLKRVQSYREKRNAVSNGVTDSVSNGVSNALVTAPENREQSSENREQSVKNGARVQGHGAATAGSLPRDHMFHAICGPRYRLCLSQTVYAGFARRYGGDEIAAKVALTTWVEALEREVGDGAIGDHLWLTRHFDAFLASVGRAPVAPPRPVEVKKPFSVQDALDREAARKAARS